MLKGMASYADLCDSILPGTYSAEQPCFGPLMTSSGVCLIAAPSLEGAVLPPVRLMYEWCWPLDLKCLTTAVSWWLCLTN